MRLKHNEILEHERFRVEPFGFGTELWLVVMNDGYRGGLLFATSEHAILHCETVFGESAVRQSRRVRLARTYL
jgi:hypothetical protein